MSDNRIKPISGTFPVYNNSKNNRNKDKKNPQNLSFKNILDQAKQKQKEEEER